MNIAVITMCHNERYMLPLWVRHYSASLPRRHLYVVDHGSTDGSTDDLGDVNVIRLPRDTFDDHKRADALSSLQRALLSFFDAVIYTDTDEFLVPDGTKYASLAAYVAARTDDVLAGIGLNVFHRPDAEPAIDLARPILEQRQYATFSAPHSKPAIVRSVTRWAAGFHAADKIPTFDPELVNFHLKAVDLGLSIERLQLTRDMKWSDAAIERNMGYHQRLDDQTYTQWFHSNREAAVNNGDVDDFAPELWIERMKRSLHSRVGFCFYSEIPSSRPVVIPERFRGL